MEGDAKFQLEDRENKDGLFFPCMFMDPLNSIHKSLRTPDQEPLPLMEDSPLQGTLIHSPPVSAYMSARGEDCTASLVAPFFFLAAPEGW